MRVNTTKNNFEQGTDLPKVKSIGIFNTYSFQSHWHFLVERNKKNRTEKTFYSGAYIILSTRG
jgi:hypothetical protein